MTNFKQLWNKSGKQYHRYCKNFSQYQKTNQELIKLAKIKDNQTVVDLACGTGLTTKEILSQNPNIKKVYAIDFSEDMIKIAKQEIKNKKVEFIISDVNELNAVIKEKANIFVCNSAFWQFENQDKLLSQINQKLKKKGVFVFNLPRHFFQSSSKTPKQQIIMENIFYEIKKRNYEIKGKIKDKLSKEQIEEVAKKNGFKIKCFKKINLGSRNLDDIFSLIKIPGVATFLEKIPEKEKEDILKESFNKIKHKIKSSENNIWFYFVLEKS